MSILKVRDENGNIIDIPALQGAKGLQGEPGLSFWMAKVSYISCGGKIFQSQLYSVAERTLQIGDLILFKDDKIAQVTGELGESENEVGELELAYEIESLPYSWQSEENSRWKLLRQITVPSTDQGNDDDVNYGVLPNFQVIFAFDKDLNGEPFDCKEFLIHYLGDPIVAEENHDWTLGVMIAPYSGSDGFDQSVIDTLQTHGFHTGSTVGLQWHTDDGIPHPLKGGAQAVITDTGAVSSIGSAITRDSGFQSTHAGMEHTVSELYKDPSWKSLCVFVSKSGIGGTTYHGFSPNTVFYIYGR